MVAREPTSVTTISFGSDLLPPGEPMRFVPLSYVTNEVVDEHVVAVRAYYTGKHVNMRALAAKLPEYPKEQFRDHTVYGGMAGRGDARGGGGVRGGAPTGRTGKGGKRLVGALLGEGGGAGRRGKKRRGPYDAAVAAGDDRETDGGDDDDDVVVSVRGSEGLDSEKHFVVFDYGGVVFFNMPSKEREEVLALVSSFCESPIPSAERNTDDYRIIVRPELEHWAKFEADHTVLKQLDVNTIGIVGTVLAQSVALDHYEQRVDAMIEVFSDLNASTEKRGKLDIKKNKLFELVARNNNTLTFVSTRMKIMSRSETAWQYPQYDEVLQHLRKDFELNQRFEHLDYKLELIQTQAKFYLDIIQNQKSDLLEWTIIILIAIEICVSLYDMSTKVG